eukprot:s1938_g7.t1
MEQAVEALEQSVDVELAARRQQQTFCEEEWTREADRLERRHDSVVDSCEKCLQGLEEDAHEEHEARIGHQDPVVEVLTKIGRMVSSFLLVRRCPVVTFGRQGSDCCLLFPLANLTLFHCYLIATNTTTNEEITRAYARTLFSARFFVGVYSFMKGYLKVSVLSLNPKLSYGHGFRCRLGTTFASRIPSTSEPGLHPGTEEMAVPEHMATGADVHSVQMKLAVLEHQQSAMDSKVSELENAVKVLRTSADPSGAFAQQLLQLKSELVAAAEEDTKHRAELAGELRSELQEAKKQLRKELLASVKSSRGDEDGCCQHRDKSFSSVPELEMQDEQPEVLAETRGEVAELASQLRAELAPFRAETSHSFDLWAAPLREELYETIRPNTFSHNAAISVCEGAREWQQAISLFNVAAEEVALDVISYNATICACGRSTEWQQALAILRLAKDP